MSSKSEQRSLISEIQALSEGDLGLERLWRSFDELSHIPRASGDEDRAIQFSCFFAKKKGFNYELDSSGNLLFFVPATKGLEKVPGIVFQGHLDMVPDGEPNPKEAGVKPFVYTDQEGQTWVRAKNSTLGADNGIGISMMFALAEERIPHGPIAFLLTNQEEVGLVSARNMTLVNQLGGYRYLFNVDSEDEGEATISSAGAADTFIDYQGKQVPVGDRKLYSLGLDGLMGGHSGVVIGENRINAARAMGYTVSQLRLKFGDDKVNLVGFESGKARNAIPKEAMATIALNGVNPEELAKELTEIRTKLLNGSQHPEEEKLRLTGVEMKMPIQNMYDSKSTGNLLQLLSSLPDGLIKWSSEVADLPETSTNIGIVGLETGNENANIQIMTRSSKLDELERVRGQISDTGELFGAKVNKSPAYSGWPPVPDSEINHLTSEAWKEVSGRGLELTYTHGGLECGVLMGRFSHLQAISIGPEIQGAHTIEERVNVASVKRCYDLLKCVVGKVASGS